MIIERSAWQKNPRKEKIVKNERIRGEDENNLADRRDRYRGLNNVFKKEEFLGYRGRIVICIAPEGHISRHRSQPEHASGSVRNGKNVFGSSGFIASIPIQEAGQS